MKYLMVQSIILLTDKNMKHTSKKEQSVQIAMAKL